MRLPLPLLLLSLCACATTSQAPAAPSARLAPFRAQAPTTQLSQKRAAIRYAAAQAILARPDAKPEEVEEAALHLEGACKDGHTASCEFLTAHAKPVHGQCGRIQVTQAFFTSGAEVETAVRCRISPAGAPESCAVVLDEPYGIAEQHLKSRQSCTYEPARLAGRPYPTYDLSMLQVEGPVRLIAGGHTEAMDDPLLEARRRVDEFPQSASAQRHLALLLEERAPGTEEHRRALQRARELLPQDAELLASAARVLMVERKNAEAFPLALKAVQERPTSLPILQTYAAASLLVGRCTEALRAQRHALAMPYLAPEGRERMTKRLAEYEQQCAAQAQPTTP